MATVKKKGPTKKATKRAATEKAAATKTPLLRAVCTAWASAAL